MIAGHSIAKQQFDYDNGHELTICEGETNLWVVIARTPQGVTTWENITCLN